MSDSLDRIEAESEANRVIEDYAITTLPICPFFIAEKAGIVVQPKDSSESGVSGFLMRVGETFGIQYARNIPSEGFIRFTIAHELGHYFLPGHAEHLFPSGRGLHKSRSGFVSSDRYERQADYFASALLMPEIHFKKAVNRNGDGFAAIEKLASEFKTSLTATAIKYTKYSPDAVAVVVSSGRHIDYCFMSDRIRDLRGINWLKKGELVPQKSTTYEFNSSINNVENALKAEGVSDLDDWFDGAPQWEMNEDVIGLGSYGKTLTILYSTDEIDESDEYDDED